MADWRGRLRMDGQRGALFAWAPVCLGLGVGFYFALPAEPTSGHWAGLAGALFLGLVAIAGGLWRVPLAVGLVLVGVGLGLGGIRNWQVAAPVLDFRYYGAVEGRIVEIDRSASDMPRLTLDRVVLERMDPDRTPARVRLSLHGAQEWLDPRPGQRIVVTAYLLPPQGPVEPGGFDFQRMAWFDRLGAVGYARTPALLLEPPGRELPVNRLRARIGAYVNAHMDGEAGAIAVALTTGDRSGIPAATLQDLRDSNLAHLLAISGLHMGILTGVVFGALRFLLAAVPGPSLRWPAKSIAAVGALAGGAVYLALSGGNVATQRAFIMVAVVLIAVILGRRAMTLRSVALAALIVLILRPEALAGPGFQMSFAATTGLIAVFRMLRDRFGVGRPGPLRFAVSLVLSSAIAGAATAPFAAAHFNQISQYGLLANILSVPLMGTVLMPAAVLAAVLAPFGLAWIGLAAMAPPIHWILAVADWVSNLDGAIIPVPSPGAAVLPMISLGALWIIVWRGRWAVAGVAPLAMAFAMWSEVTRPAVLVDASGGLVGIMGPEGRALSKPLGSGFAARVWLENDGDLADQVVAAGRPGLVRDGSTVVGTVGETEVWHVFGRGGTARAEAACIPGRIVVTTSEAADTGGCLMFTEKVLRETGSIAFRVTDRGVTIETAAAASGSRPWSPDTGQPLPELNADTPIIAESGLQAAVASIASR